MDRRNFFSMFAGLPFLSFLKEERKARVRWIKDGVNKEYCNIDVFKCVVKQPSKMIHATASRLRKPGGYEVQRSSNFECVTIDQAKEWCINEISKASREYLRISKEALSILGES